MAPSLILGGFPVRHTDTAQGRVAWRAAGNASRATHVLLHGIGSSSGNWVRQLQAAQGDANVRVLAWDAPGYGDSTPLAPSHPVAADYGRRVWEWLDGLGEQAPVVLVGHSLGALMAAAATRQQPQRVARLVLLSPAQGYGTASESEREQKLVTRLHKLETLGPAGMAADRAAAMLAPGAPAVLVDFMREGMAQIVPAGYTQAARMLSTGDLCADVAGLPCAVAVASGDADGITPPAACQAVARAAGVPWQDVPGAGHACPLEAPAPINRLLGLSTPEEVLS